MAASAAGGGSGELAVARLELSGVGIAPGVGVGTALVLHTPDAGPVGLRQIEPSESRLAWETLEAARGAAIERLAEIQSATARELGIQDAAIYGAQAAVLSDPDAVRDLKRMVQEEYLAPESAIQALLDKFGILFDQLEGGDMKGWAADLRDPWQMVLRQLDQKQEQLPDDNGPVVLIAEELTPTLLTRLPRESVAAVVCSRGGRFSHGAVLARSFGIPTISAVDGVHLKARSGERCVIYGRDGRILVGSEPAEEQAAQTLAEQRARMQGRLTQAAGEPGRTRDGHPVQILANIESPRDLEMFDASTVAGVGLFRTEFAYMERSSFPSAQDQQDIYGSILRHFGDKPVVFRTLDVGGDKRLRYFKMPEERNPALGWRGLRMSLEWKDPFLMQLQALRECRNIGRPRILLPMVTNLEELLEVKELLRAISGGEDPGVQLGVMIEVPAAALAIEDFIDEVDFVSVGTNDLTQYLFAVDRDNPWVADLYQPYHPASLRLLARVAEVCRAAGKPATVCGEMAGQRPGALFLVGAGFGGLSMAPSFAPEIKALLREADLQELQAVAKEAASCRTGAEALGRLEAATERAWDRALGRIQDQA